MSSKRFILAVALVAGAVGGLLATVPTQAASAKKMTGACRAQTFHEETRVGNKCCFVGHFHYGTGGTETTKERAMASAGDAWADFVNFEYGSRYDNFSIAVEKSFSCSGGGRQWSCSVEAVPCQPG